jgi:transcriptional regulator with XRE-family HTH domain
MGENLRKIRLEKNLSQQELCDEADIPLSQIGRIERGEVNTTISTILALSNALEVEPKALLDFEFKK